MVARTLVRCSSRSRNPFFKPNILYARPQRRDFSAAFSSNATQPSISSAGMPAPFIQELDKICPSFQINGSQIKIIKSPSDFYEALKTRIRSARKRVFLSTLYIGKTERELVDVIRHALCENRHVKLSILTDCLRGTREAPEPSCASLLASLVDEFGVERVEVRMYHTPNLTGLRKKHIPKRINEGWGLQHMKLYGVDDEIILSGANLSHDYFTDRQDRYHLFSCPDVTNYFCKLHKAVCSLSFRVLPSAQSQRFSLEWPESNRAPCPLSRPRAFVSKASSVVREHIRPGSAPEHQQDEGKDTCVFVISQMSQLMRPDDSTELLVVTHILKSLGRDEYRNSRWTFTAGYFNPAPILTKLLLQTKSTVSTVITASPYANGFYKSPGVSGLLPDAYTYLARKFLQAILNQNREEDITLKEWRKGTVGEPGAWTYHAKGLWVTLPGENSPCMSIIGSSNYSKRSHSLDLETGALIVTRDEDLKRRLGEEEAWLQEHATKVTRDDLATKERRVGLKVRIAMWIVRLVGSAL